MFSHNNRISLRQMKRLLILDVFSVSCVLIVPVAARLGDTDGILLILFSAFLAFLYALFMLFVSRQIGEDYFDFAQKAVGKAGAFIVAIFYIIKLLYSLVFLLSYFSDIIHKTLLAETNPKIILIALILIAAYEAYLGMEERGRIAEILLWFILIPFGIFIIQGVFRIDIDNLAPIFISDTKTLVSGSYGVFCIYAVFELLIFTLPYVRKREVIESPKQYHKKQRKNIVSAIITTAAFQILLFVVTAGVLGVNESKQTLRPTVIAMGIVDFPGNIIRRQDALLIGFWILSTFILLGTLLFFLSYTIKKAVSGSKHTYYIIPVSIFAFFGASALLNLEVHFEAYGKYMQYIGIPQSILIPILLILISKLRRRKQHA